MGIVLIAVRRSQFLRILDVLLCKITSGQFYLRDILKREETSLGRSAIYISCREAIARVVMAHKKAGWRLTWVGSIPWIPMRYEISISYSHSVSTLKIHMQRILPTYLSSQLFLNFWVQKLLKNKISDHKWNRELHFTSYNKGCC